MSQIPTSNAIDTATNTPTGEMLTAPGNRGRVPGNAAIWVGITCIFAEFAVLFTVYFVSRAHFPDAFHEGTKLLSRSAGALITFWMITSSFCLAASVATIRTGQRRRSINWTIAALVLALGYPITKYFEITWNLAHGIDAQAGVFIGAYYYLTLNHLVHASWGILGLLWVLGRHIWGAYSAEDYVGLEALASYWHATDIIWLAIFPFFYVLA